MKANFVDCAEQKWLRDHLQFVVQSMVCGDTDRFSGDLQNNHFFPSTAKAFFMLNLLLPRFTGTYPADTTKIDPATFGRLHNQ
jgi:hypothetical protein